MDQAACASGQSCAGGACQAAPTGLIFHLPFDGTLVDTVGSSPTFSNVQFTTDRHGVANRAGGFNGSSSSVVVNSTFNFGSTTPVTLAAWVKPNALPGGGAYPTAIHVAGGCGTAGASIVLDGDFAGKVSGEINDGCVMSHKAGLEAIQAQAWTHVALVYDGATAKVYVNGAQAGIVKTYAGQSHPSQAMVFSVGGTAT